MCDTARGARETEHVAGLTRGFSINFLRATRERHVEDIGNTGACRGAILRLLELVAVGKKSRTKISFNYREDNAGGIRRT